MNEREKLEQQLDKINKEINILDNKYLGPKRKIRSRIQDQLQDLFCKEYMGKCFVFSNCYSSDSKWPLYIKVIGIKDGSLITESFQKDCYGHITFETQKTYFSSLDDSLYKPISINEYEDEREKIMEELK